MITKEQMAILDDLEAVCKKLYKTEKGKRILTNYRNGGWSDWQQVKLIRDGLIALGMMDEDLLHMDDHDFCQVFQDYDALYLIGASYIARGMDDVTEGLVDDLKHDSNLVKESNKPLRKQTIKESRLSPRFTKLLKESSGNADYENYSYICVEVENEDGRYEAEWKEGDILNPDDVVEIMKSAETINGTADIETLNTDSPTYGDGCFCIVITLSTADNDEEEEKEVCKYWLMPRVDNPEVIDSIAYSIENASEN